MKTKISFLTVMFSFILCSVVLAEFKGTHTLDKKFESYNVKRIALDVKGSWKGTLAKVEPSKVAGALADALERKGYEVIIKKGKDDKDEQPADATLKVVYQSMTVGTLTSTEGDAYTDRAINGSVQLILNAPGKKVIFKASGGTAGVFKEMGVKDGVRVIHLGDPAEEFAKILQPLPAHPDARRESEEEKDKDIKKDEADPRKKDEKKSERE